MLATPRSRAAFALLLVAVAACGDSPTKPPRVASVVVGVPAGAIIAGTSHQLTATTFDAKGTELANRRVTWSTANAGVASVSLTGMLTAGTPGTVLVTAESEGQRGTANVVVSPVPVASVDVSPPAGELRVGDTLRLTAVTRDAANGVLNGRAVAWSSSDEAVARVSGGIVTAHGAGTARITAASEGRSGGATITVIAPGAPAITGVAPAQLVPGTTATITGTGFDVTAAGNSVSLRGVAAPVQSATATQLVVTVPCVQSGSSELRVTVGGMRSAAFAHPVAVAQRTLAPGQSVVITDPAAVGCNELAAVGGTARYLVTVFSAATSANALTALELSGNVPAGGAAMALVRMPQPAPTAVPLDPMQATMAAHERAHLQHMERDRAEYQRLRAIARTTATPSRDVAAEPLPAIGDMRSLYFTFSGGCNDVSRVMRGRAIHVGARSIIWEDSANALQSSADPVLAGYYQRLARIFEEDQYESVKKYFADPLRRDAVTDNDGRLHMVFSQRLNGTGAAAYVTSCDQFPTSTVAGSNFGQFFYGMVPTSSGLNVNSTAFADGWFNFMARTVVHEVKHVASMSARVANNAQTYEQSWLEEGTARMAEEMWVRDSLHRVRWKANTGFGTAATNGVYCDFHPSDATCNAADPLRRPSFGVRRQFNEIRPKLLQPWDWSPYGDGSGQGGAVFYNTVWSLVRYAIDRYGSSDAAFLTTLTEGTTAGVANLTAVAGVPIDQLIGNWGMALYADDYPGMPTSNTDLQFQTWNLRAIYAGLNAAPNWSGTWNTPFPIQPAQLPFGSFFAPVPSLRGGAHAYFELAGPAGAPQLLHLRGPGASVLDPALRVAIARLQ